MFKIGDCVILNHVEQPYGRLLAVVVGYDEGTYHCRYLNSDPDLDSYNKPYMECSLDEATLVEDFGIVIHYQNGEYWCEPVSESKATYKDGKTRKWQEFGGVRKYKARPEVANIVWPE